MPTSQLCDYNGNRNTLSVLFKPLPGCSLLVFWFLILLCRRTPTIFFFASSFEANHKTVFSGLHQSPSTSASVSVFPVPGHLHLVHHPEPRRIPISLAIPFTWKSFIHKRIRLWIPNKRGKTWVWMKIPPKRILKVVQSLTVNQSCLKIN